MCLSCAYVSRESQREIVMDNVTHIAQINGTVVLTDLMGRESHMRGFVAEVDFMQNEVIIIPETTPSA